MSVEAGTYEKVNNDGSIETITVENIDGKMMMNGSEILVIPDGFVKKQEGGKRRRKTMKKMSKRKMMKWCKSKKNRRTKAGRKMCKKMKK